MAYRGSQNGGVSAVGCVSVCRLASAYIFDGSTSTMGTSPRQSRVRDVPLFAWYTPLPIRFDPVLKILPSLPPSLLPVQAESISKQLACYPPVPFSVPVPVPVPFSTLHRARQRSTLPTTSLTKNGFGSTSSMPASSARWICSCRALAVMAMIGIRCVSSDPAASNARIRCEAARPSRIGISQSMRMRSIRERRGWGGRAFVVLVGAVVVVGVVVVVVGVSVEAGR